MKQKPSEEILKDLEEREKNLLKNPDPDVDTNQLRFEAILKYLDGK